MGRGFTMRARKPKHAGDGACLQLRDVQEPKSAIRPVWRDRELRSPDPRDRRGIPGRCPGPGERQGGSRGLHPALRGGGSGRGVRGRERLPGSAEPRAGSPRSRAARRARSVRVDLHRRGPRLLALPAARGGERGEGSPPASAPERPGALGLALGAARRSSPRIPRLPARHPRRPLRRDVGRPPAVAGEAADPGAGGLRLPDGIQPPRRARGSSTICRAPCWSCGKPAGSSSSGWKERRGRRCAGSSRRRASTSSTSSAMAPLTRAGGAG